MNSKEEMAQFQKKLSKLSTSTIEKFSPLMNTEEKYKKVVQIVVYSKNEAEILEKIEELKHDNEKVSQKNKKDGSKITIPTPNLDKLVTELLKEGKAFKK